MGRGFFKIRYLFIIILLAAGVFFLVYETPSSPIVAGNTIEPQTTSSSPVPSTTPKTPKVNIANTSIEVEVATTTAAVTKGLSGRLSLAADSGMLFVFSKPAVYRFWMPDMHFPLDIIWINNNRVIDITADVSNDFDPTNPKFYTPGHPAKYVLEVNAGFSQHHGLRIGDRVTFHNIN
jgi:uncharacterized protein